MFCASVDVPASAGSDLEWVRDVITTSEAVFLQTTTTDVVVQPTWPEAQMIPLLPPLQVVMYDFVVGRLHHGQSSMHRSVKGVHRLRRCKHQHQRHGPWQGLHLVCQIPRTRGFRGLTRGGMPRST